MGADDKAGFDEAMLRELLEALGDDDVVRQLLSAFCETTGELIDDIDAARGRRDLEAVRRIGHSIKGSAGNVGVASVSKAAALIEQAGHEGDAETAFALVDVLIASFQKSREAIVNGEVPGLDR